MTTLRSTNGSGGSFRLVHVSDTHLSHTHGYFDVNWAAFREAIAASPPDLLIHGGDISFNGPSAPLDLAHAKDEIAALGLPWRAILIEPERMFVIDMTGWTKRNGGTTTTLPAWP